MSYKRRIYARGILTVICFDLKSQLENGTDTRTIYESLTKRLERIKDDNWHEVVWGNEPQEERYMKCPVCGDIKKQSEIDRMTRISCPCRFPGVYYEQITKTEYEKLHKKIRNMVIV